MEHLVAGDIVKIKPFYFSRNYVATNPWRESDRFIYKRVSRFNSIEAVVSPTKATYEAIKKREGLKESSAYNIPYKFLERDLDRWESLEVD